MRELSTKFSLSLSHTIKSLQTGKPCYLRSLLSFTSNRSTRSSSFITLNRPSNYSRLKITNRSFYHPAPASWNTLPPDLRRLSHHFTSSQTIRNSPVSAISSSFSKAQDSSSSFFIFSIVCRPILAWASYALMYPVLT